MQGKLSFEAVQQLATEELLEKYIDSRYGPGRMLACTACGLPAMGVFAVHLFCKASCVDQLERMRKLAMNKSCFCAVMWAMWCFASAQRYLTWQGCCASRQDDLRDIQRATMGIDAVYAAEGLQVCLECKHEERPQLVPCMSAGTWLCHVAVLSGAM